MLAMSSMALLVQYRRERRELQKERQKKHEYE